MTPRRFALLVGNHHYDNPSLAQLSASTGDATDFAAILQDGQFGGFDEVQTLIDQSVDEIRKGMARFFSSRGRDDLLLMYFSGHGVLDDRGKLYLAAKDTEPDLLSATAIDAAFVTDAMDRCRSTSQVLILDCCHSGAFARGAKGVVGGSVGTAAAFEGIGSGRVILTATDATQYAWEGDRIIGQAENSLFTHYLLEGLRTGKADLNQDGWVTLDEWYDYVFEQVINATPKQTPAKWSYKQQGEIWVARNPHPSPKTPSLPQELQDSILDPRSWVREGAVAELIRLLHASPEITVSAVTALQTLVKDDSRRVSSAAVAGLEEYQANKSLKASEKPVAASIKAEDPLFESERIARNPAIPALGVQPEAQSIASSPPEPVKTAPAAAFEISAPGTIEQVTTGEPVVSAWEKITAFLRSSSLLQSTLFPVTVAWCLGWFLSLGLALLGDDSRLMFLGWGIAGLCGDLALWRFYRSSQLSSLPLLAAGWPLSLLLVAILFPPLYAIFDYSGSDIGKSLLTIGSLLLWMALATFFNSLRILPVDKKSDWRRFVLTAMLCWGGAFLLTLLITGIGNWNIALVRFVTDYPWAVIDNLGGNEYAYFALSANGILTALLGFFAWSRLNGVSRS